MKKIYLIFFLFIFSIASAEKVEVEGVYRNTGDIAPNETCRLAKERAKLKALERVTGHKRGDDGIECITLYEDVPFVDQYIPTPSVVVSTAVIATVAATTPIILNLVKPIVKQIIKKLTKK